jgi:lysophospholipase L1-like esterase
VYALQYGSLQEALAATVKVYTTLLLQLVQQQGLRVYVHPVPPVLDATRETVNCFNAALQQRLSSALQTQPELAGHLMYLDVAQHLLREDGSRLQQQLQLDGTHLHPRYSNYLEAALHAELPAG